MKKPKTEELDTEVLDQEYEVQKTIEDNTQKKFFYWIRPKVNNEDSVGLSKYGKSKWTNCLDIYHPIFDERLKKWLTGLDEYDPEILSITNKEEREKRQKEVKELRESLERLTGENLSPSNDEFWIQQVIKFSEKTKPLVPYLNPRDRITVEWLKRRGDIPFGSFDLYNERYMDAKFYIETEDESINKRKSTKNLQKEALATSFKLEDDYDRLWKICSLLHINKDFNINAESLINKLDEWIERNKKYADRLEELVNLSKKSIQELEGLSVFQMALDMNFIYWDGKTKCYHRGGTNFGSTKDEAVRFLTNPEHGHIFVEVKNLVEQKKRTSRGLK